MCWFRICLCLRIGTFLWAVMNMEFMEFFFFYLLNIGQSNGQKLGQSMGVGAYKIVRTKYLSLTKLLFHSQRVFNACKRGRNEIINNLLNSLIYLSLFLFLFSRRLLFEKLFNNYNKKSSFTFCFFQVCLT